MSYKKHRYILFHKPYGVLSQFTSDSHLTLNEYGLPKNVYPVGRLDKDSEGLLLLSNDGKFIKKFLEFHPRKYWAQVEGVPTESQLNILRNGVKIKFGITKPCEAMIIPPPAVPERIPPIRQRKSIPTTWLELTLFEGKNRQVRKMTAAIGNPTLRLFRSGLGKLSYTSYSLSPGNWEEVSLTDIM